MLLSWYLLFLPLSPKITIYILDMNVEGIKNNVLQKCTNEFFPHKMKNGENWFSSREEKSLEERIASKMIKSIFCFVK